MSQYCEKCGKTMNENQFYSSRNKDKYPNGLLNTCKRCITMHVDNWNPETFTWILKEVDVPYVKELWDDVIKKEQSKGKRIGPMTIIGRYMAKMKLKQWADKRWADSDRLQEESTQQKINNMKAQGFSGEEIDEQLAIDRTPEKPDYLNETQKEVDTPEYINIEDEEDEFSQSLTEEDKTYLRLKWGRGYRTEEWIRMEQLYNDMMESYDIQGAGTKDTLIMICKASLKVNLLMDCGDIDGAQKAAKMYDSLMRSANLTAAQNKADKGEYVDSVGELVAICEKQGFIPKYYTDGPQDMVDKVLQDMQYYTRSLIVEEMNLGNMLDAAIKGIEKDRVNEASMAVDDGEGDEIVFDEYQGESPVEDADYEEFEEMQDEIKKANDEYFQSLQEE